MSREKQIEEMAKVLCEDCARDTSPCVLTKTARMCESVKEQAEALYNAGYRKQSEGEWISNCQTDEFICSLCGAIAPVDCLKEDFYKSNFCPNCGAKMKGEQQ